MSFFSLQFAAFITAALIVYYLLPKKCGRYVLLAVSLAFYAWGGFRIVFYLLFTAATTYLTGLALGAMADRDEKDGKVRRGRRKAVLAVCAALNFSLLFFVKYSGVLSNLFSAPGLSIAAPLGLSFYMFSSVGYVIDCYRGKQKAERNPFSYLLFVSFFPTVVQGPIMRYRRVAQQFDGAKRSADCVKHGVQLAMWGCLKKLIVANRAAVIADRIFSSPGEYGGVFTAFGVLFYCIQLYCDFSGGIDVARGVARMFGVDLPENFRRPIFAVSLADYWRRWHITLGEWMRDYVFYPLALSRPLSKLGHFTRKHLRGKAGKVIPTAIATFTVYILIGIWHGSSLKYVFFGFYNGAILTMSILLSGPFASVREKLHIGEKSVPHHIFCVVRTAAIVFVGRYFTRAPRLLTAFAMLKKTFTHPCLYQLSDGTVSSLGLSRLDYAVVAAGVLVILLVEFIQERGVGITEALDRRGAFVQWIFIFLPLAFILAQIVFGGKAIDPTSIYQQY